MSEGERLRAGVGAEMGIANLELHSERSACCFMTAAQPSVRSMPIVTGTKAIVLPEDRLK